MNTFIDILSEFFWNYRLVCFAIIPQQNLFINVGMLHVSYINSMNKSSLHVD